MLFVVPSGREVVIELIMVMVVLQICNYDIDDNYTKRYSLV